METTYSPLLVILSLIVAIFASFVALDLVGSVTQAHGRLKQVWLFCGALAMGLGIWSMHYIGMLAFSMPGMMMSYDIPLVIISIIIAVIASTTALYVVSRPTVKISALVLGGILMASAITGMHYVGMYSMRMDAIIIWNPWLVALSIIIALAASFAALFVSLQLRSVNKPLRLQIFASILMGCGIAGMHYTGMEAASFVHDHHAETDPTGNLLATSDLNYIVITTTVVILVLALIGSVLDRAFSIRRKKIQDSARLYREAEEANITKTRFLANMSHEIRTPLSAIIGFTDLLLNEEMSESEQKQYLKIVHRSAHSLSQLIDEILDLSKVEMGHLRIEPKVTNLKYFIEEILSLLKIKSDEKGLLLKFKTAPNFPENTITDSFRLRQILLNIIGNAIKFTDRGEVSVTQRLFKENNVDFLEFEVRDTGIGLTPEEQKRIFKAFSQADNSMTRKFGGTGLGLDISKKLALALGGDLFLSESTPQKGSVFLVRIAHTETPGIVEIKSSTENQRTINPEKLKGLSILLVDDVPDNQLLIARYLQKKGAHVEFADNGAEAVSKALEGNHHLILMDIQMPIMDGYEATRTLRSKNYKKPIIALTAHAMPEERDVCLQSGCTDYITKPVDIFKLSDMIVVHAGEFILKS